MLGLTGCQDKEHGLSPKAPVTITLWHYYNGELKNAFDYLVEEFNETLGKEKGIIVDALGQGGVNDLADAVSKSANQEAGALPLPNIFATYVDTAMEVDSLGLLVPLDDYFTKAELEAYVPSYIEEGRRNTDGKLIVFPVAKSTELLMINKTAFDAFSAATGVTTADLATWEGLATAAQKYYTFSGGKAFFGRDAHANYTIIGCKQLGKELFAVSDSNEVALQMDKAVMRRLWDNFYLPYVNGYYLNHGRFSTDDAKTGDIIALVGSSSGANYFPKEVAISEKESQSIECVVLPVPNFEGTSPYAVQQGAGMAVTKSDEKHEYASSVFLKWFTEKDRNIEFSARSAYLPVKTEANDTALMQQIVKDKGINMSAVTEVSLEVAIEQVKNYTLYTNKPFKNSYDARQVLENALLKKAQADRLVVEQKVADGAAHDEAVAAVATDETFDAWYAELEKQLTDLITKS